MMKKRSTRGRNMHISLQEPKNPQKHWERLPGGAARFGGLQTVRASSRLAQVASKVLQGTSFEGEYSKLATRSDPVQTERCRKDSNLAVVTMKLSISYIPVLIKGD